MHVWPFHSLRHDQTLGPLATRDHPYGLRGIRSEEFSFSPLSLSLFAMSFDRRTEREYRSFRGKIVGPSSFRGELRETRLTMCVHTHNLGTSEARNKGHAFLNAVRRSSKASCVATKNRTHNRAEVDRESRSDVYIRLLMVTDKETRSPELRSSADTIHPDGRIGVEIKHGSRERRLEGKGTTSVVDAYHESIRLDIN